MKFEGKIQVHEVQMKGKMLLNRFTKSPSLRSQRSENNFNKSEEVIISFSPTSAVNAQATESIPEKTPPSVVTTW